MSKRMKTLIVLCVTVLCASLFNLAAATEAKTMEAHEALTPRQQGIIPIAAFTAGGDLESLKAALQEGLEVGLTVNEIKEIVVQLYAYAGFPRSLNAIGAFMTVLEEREKKGIKDQTGREPSAFPRGKSSIERGTEIQTRLAGKPVKGPIYAFAPAIDQFLKGHLFGDIFSRDNLDFGSREIATISALASMKGVHPQLQAHIDIGFNVGISETQMRCLIAVLAAKVGREEAENANEVLGKVLKSRPAAR